MNKEGVGFVPGWTTVGGLINSYKQNDAYRKGLINGLGYSNRAEQIILKENQLKRYFKIWKR